MSMCTCATHCAESPYHERACCASVHCGCWCHARVHNNEHACHEIGCVCESCFAVCESDRRDPREPNMDIAKEIEKQVRLLNRIATAAHGGKPLKRDAEFYEDSSDVLDQQTDSEVVEEYRGRRREDE